MEEKKLLAVLATNMTHYMSERGGLSQMELSRRSGASQAVISRCLNPKAGDDLMPNLRPLSLIATGLGVEVWHLLRPIEKDEREIVGAFEQFLLLLRRGRKNDLSSDSG